MPKTEDICQGRLEDPENWKILRIETWKIPRIENWKIPRIETWKIRRIEIPRKVGRSRESVNPGASTPRGRAKLWRKH